MAEEKITTLEEAAYYYEQTRNDLDAISDNEIVRRAFIAGAEWQKKQEPAEWSEEDQNHLIWLCRIIHSRVVNKELSLAEESELGKWMDKWLNHKPQPVQKWDEFDEDCLKRAIWYVENPAPSVVKDTNLALWLKSLPLNLKKKNEDVAKLCSNEWSEEDERMRNELITIMNGGKVTSGTYLSEYAAWLKSLRPQPHWKPTEEQMKALLWCTAHLGGADHRVLAELYEQLKAIKEGEK